MATIIKPEPVDSEVIWDKTKVIISETNSFGTITNVNNVFLEGARICALTSRSVYLCALPATHNFAVSSPGWLRAFSLIRSVEGAGEAYRLADGVPFPAGGPADDLFAGLGV